jgi:endoglucanase
VPAAARVGARADVGIVLPPLTPNVVVDQFGYPPASEKVAVLRDPRSGFDSTTSFVPGGVYAVVDARSGARVLEAAPEVWNSGATDSSSGDRAWWFDFTSVRAQGTYFILDEARGERSPLFRIDVDVYRAVLRQAQRMLYYQRDGIAKDVRHAGPEWADAFVHPQDLRCELYSGGSPRDLRGGWFDAGDQNRYTTFASVAVIELLRGYVENRGAFGDDTDIPESGNGVPDILDEVKWELDWMLRMQEGGGSVLSIASHKGASPPSSDRSPCRYGPANTAATLAAAAAFGYAAVVFDRVPAAVRQYPGFARLLATRAQSAWDWASANPDVRFSNSSVELGAGEQDLTGDDRLAKRLQAAVFLLELTGDEKYRGTIDEGYLLLLSALDPFHLERIDTALEYAGLPGATPSVARDIVARFKSSVEGPSYFGVHASSNPDPYLAYLPTYVWGSNQIKAAQGSMFADLVTFRVDAERGSDAVRFAERYVHYLHGVNPLQVVYLSNMSGFGAERSVGHLFHTWFGYGSRWDAPGPSGAGAPPGYLAGGPDQAYQWDACCPRRCGWFKTTSCGEAPPSPPAMQPAQKSYRDFDDPWPLNSWQVSEPDVAYQAHYVRLLSKFVP